MSLSGIDKLGGKISGIANEVDTTKQSISPDEAAAQQQIYSNERITIVGELVVNKLTYTTSSFILDHPVYGELDNVNYEMDGGYAQFAGAPFPLAFPFSFGGSTTVELFRTTW